MTPTTRRAHVDGARVGFEGVKPIVAENDPEPATAMTERFADLQSLLDEQKACSTDAEGSTSVGRCSGPERLWRRLVTQR